MSRVVFCKKLNQEAEGLESKPVQGDLGEAIYEHISKKAWNMWLSHQTMLINEYRLSLIDPKAREFLHEEMQKYFFGEGSHTPEGFKPQNTD